MRQRNCVNATKYIKKIGKYISVDYVIVLYGTK